MAENTREIILDTLLTLERGKEFSHKLIKAVLDKYDYLDTKEKAFIKRVTEGTIERKLELDYYLNSFSKVPVSKMKPLIRCLLRMSTYQILYMDSVPDSAVCNEACKLAGKRKFQNLKGFVNGILRNISKQKNHMPLPNKEKEKVSYFSVKYSMPEWLVSMWLKEYGEEITITLLENLLKVHSVSLRFSKNLSPEDRQELVKEMQKKGVKLQKSAYIPFLYTMENTENISLLPGFAEGKCTVQDISSVLAVEAAGIKTGDFVIDICAAPGGKSIFAAETAEKVLARDLSESKIASIETNLQRMKIENVITEIYDATKTDENYLEKADVLILDVPCSGLGVMGKKRDIKYHATPESLESIVKLQKEIVEKSWQYVKPGGILLYSTCTIHKAENEEMVQWILENFPFQPETLEPNLPEKLLLEKQLLEKKLQKSVLQTQKEKDACIQLLPGFMEADGFFFAKLRRVC